MERMLLLGTVIVLAGAIGLLQAHGIQFWAGRLGPYGIAWSALLEATALWLWWRGTLGSRLLGLAASGLLLLGPLYQVGTPILEGLAAAEHTDSARMKAIALVETEIQELESQLATFTENSQKRSGWLPAIEATQVRLGEARDKLAELQREIPQSTMRAQAQETLVIGMEILGLLLFQVAAVLAIMTLSREARMGKVTLPSCGMGFIGHWPADLAPETAAVVAKGSASAKPAKAREIETKHASRTDSPTEAHTGNVVTLTEVQGKNPKLDKTWHERDCRDTRTRGKRAQNAKRKAQSRISNFHTGERV